MNFSIGSIAFVGMMALAQVSNAEAITPGTDSIGDDFFLARGETRTVTYTVDLPDTFQLDLSFSGTGSRANLGLVRYGIETADKSYQFVTGGANASSGLGILDTLEISGPFSVVYSLAPTATARTYVTFYGAITPTNVPEIGAAGALPAMLLALGSVAVMAGGRRAV